MSRPTQILRHEHRVIEQALRALDGMCLTLKSGGNVPPEALYQILDFIQNFADRFHHAREATYLFPALGQNGFQKEGGALRFLTEEHELERLLTAELERAIGEYRHGDSSAVDRFVEAAEPVSRPFGRPHAMRKTPFCSDWLKRCWTRGLKRGSLKLLLRKNLKAVTERSRNMNGWPRNWKKTGLYSQREMTFAGASVGAIH